MIAVLALLLAAADPPLPTIQDVMGRLDDMYRSTSAHAKLKMSVKTEFYDRELELESWSRGDERALIVVRAPAREAGTATLRSPEGLWSYAPRADRLLRIPSGMLSESWMGSHFTNEDLVRETDYEKDYETTLAWLHQDGKRLLQAEMKPRPDTPVVWTRMVYVIDPDGWVPVRAQDYDGDKVVRSTTFADVRTVAGKRVPMVMTVVPSDKPKERTRLEYLLLELNVPVDEGLFSARGLRRAAGK